MTFSRADRPLTRWNCWKMKPKAFRRISVRNRSGRLVISRPPRKILPEVGRAMHPRRDRSVVFPDPLGPLRTVVRPGSIAAVIPSRAQNSLGFPAWKTFRTSFSSILAMAAPYALITASGSVVAARQEGTTVANVYGTTVRKKRTETRYGVITGFKRKSG